MPDSNAVTIVEQSPDAVVEWNLDNWPIDKFNRLVPTQTLGLATEFIRPIVAVVQLDIEADTYESRDLKQGHRAPNARGLSKLADAAGVNFVDEVRLDDGSDPGRAYVRVYAELVDGTGMKRRAPGSRDYVLDSQAMTDAQRARAKAYVHEHAATRARHRALRALLSLPQSYPVAELQKPFAVVRYVPNTAHPEIREAFKAAMVGSIAALYGPEPARQLAAGPAIEELPEIDDEDPRNVTPAPASPTVMPGERLRAAAQRTGPEDDEAIEGESRPVDEPAWFGEPQAETMPQTLLRVLREKAASYPGTGPATAEQRARLQPVMKPLGLDATAAGLRLVFGLEDLRSITTGQADAILACSVDDEFVDLWRELVAGEGKAAAA